MKKTYPRIVVTVLAVISAISVSGCEARRMLA